MNNQEVDYSRYVRREDAAQAEGSAGVGSASHRPSQDEVSEAIAAGDDVAVRGDMLREGGFTDLVKRLLTAMLKEQ